MNADQAMLDVSGTLAASSEDQPPQVLVTEDLSVHFSGIAALEGVNTTVGHGDVVAIIGPNGAGKTTYLNALSGLLRSYASGKVWLNGVRADTVPASTLACRGLGRSFQHPPLLLPETVLTNVLIGGHSRMPYGRLAQIFRPRKVARIERQETERARQLLEDLGLLKVVDKVAGELSFGTMKLVDIARAVFTQPRLLLLDEPTSGLDFQEQERVVELLQSLRSSGRLSVIVVEHHMEIVRKTATAVIGLQAGTVLESGSPDEVLNSEVFLEAMVGTSTAGEIEDPGMGR
jgi:branched-chain amino acid transport system ATP-binding protein